MDGNFGSGYKSGPSVAREIKRRYPDSFIIGRSGEDRMNKRFRRAGVDLVIPKNNEGDWVSRFGEILTLLEDRILEKEGSESE